MPDVDAMLLAGMRASKITHTFSVSATARSLILLIVFGEKPIASRPSSWRGLEGLFTLNATSAM